MTQSARLPRLLAACGWLAAIACAPHPSVSSTPVAQHSASDYEIYNPTPCEAVAVTLDEAGLTRTELGRIPSGGRSVFRVPSLPAGTRVVATATAPDGTDCSRGYEIVVRRLDS